MWVSIAIEYINELEQIDRILGSAENLIIFPKEFDKFKNNLQEC